MKKTTIFGISIVTLVVIVLGVSYFSTINNAKINAETKPSETVDCCAE